MKNIILIAFILLSMSCLAQSKINKEEPNDSTVIKLKDWQEIELSQYDKQIEEIRTAQRLLVKFIMLDNKVDYPIRDLKHETGKLILIKAKAKKQ